MEDSLFIKVPYFNAFKELKSERIYEIGDYTSMLRADILRIITDVEDLVYDMCGNVSKDEWDPKVRDEFNHIKHKLLDKGNDIGRIPENLCNKEDIQKESVEDFVRKLGE